MSLLLSARGYLACRLARLNLLRCPPVWRAGWPPWLLLVMGLCGAAGTARADLAPADYFYPLAPGATWTYQGAEGEMTYTVKRTVLPATRTLHGVAASGIQEWVDDEPLRVTWVSGSAGIRYHREEFDPEVAAFYESWMAESPIVYAPGTVAEGSSYSFSTRYAALDPDGSQPGTFSGTITGITQVSGFETITVKAGTFNGLKLRITETWSSPGYLPSTITSTLWLAQGVGIIKSVESLEGWDTTRELQSYSIPTTNPLPAIVSPPASLTVNAGADATFSVVASGTEPLAYQWQFQGTDLAGQNATTLRLIQVQTNQAGEYRVKVSNRAGSVTSAVATLTVTPPAVTNAPLRILSANRRNESELELVFQSEPATNYQLWASTNLNDWLLLEEAGAAGLTSIFRDLAMNQHERRFYRVKVAGAAPAAPVIAAQPQSQTVLVGGQVDFSVTASGNGLRYQWKKDGAGLAGATNAVLHLAAITMADAGSYAVEVSNPGGSVVSAGAVLSVRTESPVATLPEPGREYPTGTRLGGAIFGIEFTIPSSWRGGLRVKSSLLMFYSDTKPGLVLGLLGFAGTQETILSDPAFRNGFELESNGEKTYFQPMGPAATMGTNRITAEFQGANSTGLYYIGLQIVVHPDGGFLGFLGLTTLQQRAIMQGQLQVFGEGVQISSRHTHLEYMGLLSGRSFKWFDSGNEWYANQAGFYPSSQALSSWGNSYAYFCSGGTFEVTKTTETFASVNSPTTGFMSLSGSDTTTEYGQWTIIQTLEYGSLMLMATLSGYQVVPVRLNPDGSLLVGPNKLTPYGTFNCQP